MASLVCKCWLKVHRSRLFCELSVFISSFTAINPETIACLAAFCTVPQWLKQGSCELYICIFQNL